MADLWWRSTLLISDDGKAWKRVDTGLRSACYGAIARDGEGFVMISQGGIVRSEHGMDWEGEISKDGGRLQAVAVSCSTLVGVGNAGVIAVCKRPGLWQCGLSPTIGNLYGVAYGKGRFIVVGVGGNDSNLRERD